MATTNYRTVLDRPDHTRDPRPKVEKEVKFPLTGTPTEMGVLLNCFGGRQDVLDQRYAWYELQRQSRKFLGRGLSLDWSPAYVILRYAYKHGVLDAFINDMRPPNGWEWHSIDKDGDPDQQMIIFSEEIET